jgi:two-component system, chemotaxis family, sensor kinase CheA
MNELGAILQEFVVEAGENLDQLERGLLELETNPSSRETLSAIFRTAHTIKGAAGFVGLPKVEALAHSGESVLSRLRDGTLTINPAISNTLLALADAIRETVAHVGAHGCESDKDCSGLIAELACIQESGCGVFAEVPVTVADTGDPERAVASSSVRVNVEQLDRLMNLVGELVLARNEIMQFNALRKDAVLVGTSQRLSAITTQLQEGIMKTRMQPIDNVWSRLPRIARDCAQQCGKIVRLDMEGRDTELDRTLIEAIQDPLTHVLRNCIDHGVETPERRLAAGKGAEGRIVLRAFHEGGQVTVEVSDDGRGIDVGGLKRRALERGLISPEQARSMTDQDAVNLIFLPGLSTAAKVTNISGRGVGMDVVKTNIEQIGGRVTVQSQPGAGTTLRMRIPLTLAIMTALVVTSGDECYAIPQVNVLELVRLDGRDAHDRIEMVRDAGVYRLRGELLPVVWLAAELTGNRRCRPASASDCDSAANIVVLQADTAKFALVVDDVSDMREIVVKPLSRFVRSIPIFAGATITGNARVVLILDVPGLAVHANVLSEVREPSLEAGEVIETTGDEEPLLLFAGPHETPMAARLAQVARLESFPRGSIELVAGRAVVQYFGGVLELVHIADVLRGCGPSRPPIGDSSEDALLALVYSKDGRQLGIVVDRILDTIEASLSGMNPATRRGIAGALVIQGRVTEVLDLDVLCRAGSLEPAWSGAGDGVAA